MCASRAPASAGSHDRDRSEKIPPKGGSTDQRQSSGQWASNRDGDTTQWFKNGGGVVTNVGLNNNTLQLGFGNQSNGNTNTAGPTTGFIGNNDQQENTQGLSQHQTTGEIPRPERPGPGGARLKEVSHSTTA